MKTRSFSDGPLVTVLGVEDLVVVATTDAVLVLPLDRTQDVKTVIDQLKAERRDESSLHQRVYRPSVRSRWRSAAPGATQHLVNGPK